MIYKIIWSKKHYINACPFINHNSLVGKGTRLKNDEGIVV